MAFEHSELRIQFADEPVTQPETVPLFAVTVTSENNDLDDWDRDEGQHGPTNRVHHYALSFAEAERIADREIQALVSAFAELSDLDSFTEPPTYRDMTGSKDNPAQVDAWMADRGYDVRVRHLCNLRPPNPHVQSLLLQSTETHAKV
jgi:hypothetical protein